MSYLIKNGDVFVLFVPNESVTSSVLIKYVRRDCGFGIPSLR
jgi:hypothetical protein